jgi:ABC-type branched-subunit amino acid transport system substrate-binding protein
MMVKLFDRRWLAGLAGLACVAAVFAVMSGPSRAATKSCSGSPAAFSLVANLSNTASGVQIAKDIAGGFRAAAAAINKSCELGRPLKLIVCDEQNSPNVAAACGREAAAAKVFGVAGYTSYGDSYAPPVVAAQIPIMPFAASSSTEASSPLSYPFGDSIPVVMSSLPAAKALGIKRLALLRLDVPSIGFLIGLVKKQAARFGIQIVEVPVPPTATDMTTYVAQALAANPDSLTAIVGPASLSAIFKQVRTQGKTFPLISFSSSMTPATIKSLPRNITNGLVLANWSRDPASPSERNNPAVKQYLRELKAAKQPSGPRDVTTNSLAAWGELHSIADAFKAKRLAPTAANVPRAMLTSKMPTITQKYGLIPRDFRKNPFASDPTLKNLRIFSSTSFYYRINSKQQPIALVSKPVSILKTPTFIKK